MPATRRRWCADALVAGLIVLGSITVGAGRAAANSPPSLPPASPSATTAEAGDPCASGPSPADSASAPSDDTAPPDTAAPETAAPGSEAGTGALDIPLPAETTGGSFDTGVPLAGSVPVDEIVVLGRDGIGLVGFCTDAEEAIATVSGVLGAPDDDTGWADPLTISACSGTEVRRVTWGSLDLYFGDVSRFAAGRPHFFGYSYGDVDGFDVSPPGLATPEGIGLGTSVAFLRAAYPAVSLIPGEEGIQEPTFYVDESLRGLLTDVADDGVVTVVIGGEACAF